MTEHLTITLGARQFAVRPLTFREDAVWRQRAKPLVEPIAELAMATGLANPTPDRLVKLAFTSALFIDPQEMLDVVLAYSPELADEREWIESHGYPAEGLEALLTLFFGQGRTSARSGAAPPRSAMT